MWGHWFHGFVSLLQVLFPIRSECFSAASSVSQCRALVASGVICLNMQLQVQHVPWYLCCCQIRFLFDWCSQEKQAVSQELSLVEGCFIFSWFASRPHEVTSILYFYLHSRIHFSMFLWFPLTSSFFAQTCHPFGSEGFLGSWGFYKNV